MPNRPDGLLEALRRRIEGVVQLGSDEVEAILALPIVVRQVRAGTEIVREGDHPTQACLILEGVGFRFKIVGDGARQIFSYHIPGDIPDLQSLYLERMDHSLAALTNSKVAYIPHRSLYQLFEAHPRVAGFFWRETLIDGAVFREWISNIGRRSALSRIAHVICELYVRFRAIGAAVELTIPFPVTQTVLADAQGMSTVHVNRIMQELRSAKLIRVGRKELTILDWPALVELADFQDDYLHLRPAA